MNIKLRLLIYTFVGVTTFGVYKNHELLLDKYAFVMKPQQQFKVPSSDVQSRDYIAEKLAQGHYLQTSDCKGVSEPITQKAGTQVFTWVDEQGITQFSDQPPSGVKAKTQTLQSTGKDYFDLDVKYDGVNIPPFINNQIESGGIAIYSVLESMLPSQSLVRAHLNITIYSNESAFNAFKEKNAPSLGARVHGFYISRGNQISVLYKGDNQRVRQIALHETTHAIQNKLFARAGGWFSEGLAEYFEDLETQGHSAYVPVDKYWVNFLKKKSNRLPLTLLFSASYDNWKGSDSTRYYANSWAVAYFLMAKERSALMKRYLKMLADHRCEQIDNLLFFNEHYPGGVPQLESDVRSWLYRNHNVPNYH